MTNASIGIFFTKNRIITRANSGFDRDVRLRGRRDGLGLPTARCTPTSRPYERLGAEAYGVLSGQALPDRDIMVRKDGTPMWVQLIGYAVNPDDPGQGTIWMIEDRTEPEARRGIAAQRPAGEPGHPRQRGAGHRGGRERPHAALQPQDGRAVRLRPGGAIDGASVRALLSDTASWESGAPPDPRDFASGPRAHGRV
jgi:hypothetical protein